MRKVKAIVKVAKRSSPRALVILLLIIPFLILSVPPAMADKPHWGYSHDSSIGSPNPNWMGGLSDDLKLSQLSIPGTHDTMALYGLEKPLEYLPPEVSEISEFVKDIPVFGDIWKLFLDAYEDKLDVWSICQTLSLENQLEAGIRALDIRVRHVWEPAVGENQFLLYHGETYQKGDFQDVLSACAKFLSDHDGETILMRVKHEGNECHSYPPHPDPPHGGDAYFDDTFLRYLNLTTGLSEKETYLDYIWSDATWWSQPWDDLEDDEKPEMPTLGDVRKKIVIMQNFPSNRCFGIPWDDSRYFDDEFYQGIDGIQDKYNLDDWYDWSTLHAIENVVLKWNAVKWYLKKTAERTNYDKIFVNCLNGVNNICPPYMVASGHIFLHPEFLVNPAMGPAPGTGGKHDGRYVWELLKDPPMGDLWDDGKGILSDYPHEHLDWPLVAKFTLEGVNEMTYQYLYGKFAHWPVPEACGIILADFPGHELIEQIISLNPFNRPPVADANGPYEGDEGSEILFDASGSSDPDGDALEYMWDFDGDGNWDTSWLSEATASHTWYDEYSGEVRLQVRDGKVPTGIIDTTSVKVDNVAPTVVLTGDTIDENDYASVQIAITDPGINDAFSVTINWGDESPEESFNALNPGSTIELKTHQYLDDDDDPPGTPTDDYTVTVTVDDYDGGSTTETVNVTVNNVAPTVEAGADQTVNEGESVSFSGSFTDPGTLDTHSVEWDFGDGSTASGALTPTHAYGDNGVYTVTLRVEDDDGGVGEDTLKVTVNNVAPAVTSVSMEQPNPHFILPIVHTLTFTGNFADPGWLDTHTIEWNFGDGSIEVGTLTEENEEPDATGTTTVEHAYSEPGTYTVTLTVDDGDGGIGTATWVVTVLTAEEATTVINDNIQVYPVEAFNNCPDQKKNTFSNKLDAVIKQISEGAYQEAIDMLRDDIQAKADGPLGCGPSHDWITDPGAQKELCAMIQDLTDYLETLL